MALLSRRRPDLYGDLVNRKRSGGQFLRDFDAACCGWETYRVAKKGIVAEGDCGRRGLWPPVPVRIFCCGTPLAKYTITAAAQNMHPDSSIFEGCKVPANARHVFPRGKLAVERTTGSRRRDAAAHCIARLPRNDSLPRGPTSLTDAYGLRADRSSTTRTLRPHARTAHLGHI